MGAFMYVYTESIHTEYLIRSISQNSISELQVFTDYSEVDI